MDATHSRLEVGCFRTRPIPDGYHDIQVPVCKLPDMFRMMSGQIQALFGHEFPGHGMNVRPRLDTAAEHLGLVFNHDLEHGLGHLTAPGVAGADEKNFVGDKIYRVLKGLICACLTHQHENAAPNEDDRDDGDNGLDDDFMQARRGQALRQTDKDGQIPNCVHRGKKRNKAKKKNH